MVSFDGFTLDWFSLRQLWAGKSFWEETSLLIKGWSIIFLCYFVNIINYFICQQETCWLLNFRMCIHLWSLWEIPHALIITRIYKPCGMMDQCGRVIFSPNYICFISIVLTWHSFKHVPSCEAHIGFLLVTFKVLWNCL